MSEPSETRDIGAHTLTDGALTTERAHQSNHIPAPNPAQASVAPTRGLRAMLRRIPKAALVCALVAVLNAACWSIVTPPFEVTDEPDHFAYVKQLAETGHLPSTDGERLSSEEQVVVEAVLNTAIREQPQFKTIGSLAQQRVLDRALAEKGGETGSSSAGVATSEPPLYYALEAIPYTIARSGTILDRLALMRLLSALMGGLTALFAFMFIREALPREPWAWTVGGLAVALAPLLGFVSGGVNPDALLFAISAAIFYALARAFRRGLSTRGAAVIGALTALGFLTKLNFIGLAPGIVLALIVLNARVARSSKRTALQRLTLALTIAFSPVIAYAAINLLSDKPTLGFVSGALETSHPSLLGEFNYIWQLYLPRIPGTFNDFPGLFPTQQLWFDGYVGLYGWLDTQFPDWVYTVALIPTAVLAVLLARGLFAVRHAVRARALELVVYTAIGAGVLALIGTDAYHGFPLRIAEYDEPRYMLPMLALMGAAMTLAARGAGRRWGPPVGALIVVLFLTHDIFSQLLEVARYYG